LQHIVGSLSCRASLFGADDRDRYTLRKVAELRLIVVFECRNCRLSQADVLGLIERYGDVLDHSMLKCAHTEQ
jgi:hypothetical protein